MADVRKWAESTHDVLKNKTNDIAADLRAGMSPPPLPPIPTTFEPPTTCVTNVLLESACSATSSRTPSWMWDAFCTWPISLLFPGNELNRTGGVPEKLLARGNSCGRLPAFPQIQPRPPLPRSIPGICGGSSSACAMQSCSPASPEVPGAADCPAADCHTSDCLAADSPRAAACQVPLCTWRQACARLTKRRCGGMAGLRKVRHDIANESHGALASQIAQVLHRTTRSFPQFAFSQFENSSPATVFGRKL